MDTLQLSTLIFWGSPIIIAGVLLAPGLVSKRYRRAAERFLLG
jgi:hypothetical protein